MMKPIFSLPVGINHTSCPYYVPSWRAHCQARDPKPMYGTQTLHRSTAHEVNPRHRTGYESRNIRSPASRVFKENQSLTIPLNKQKWRV